MSSDNDLTVQSYNDHVQDYVTGTSRVIDGEFKEWMNHSLKLIPKGGTVLEIGSGFGRDAAYIESLGYKVIKTDAAQGFVDFLQEKGYKAQLLNVLTDRINGVYDMVFAHAVFLHFKPSQLQEVLIKTRDSLKPKGVLVFSVKQGSGSKWTRVKLGAPRYFHYWNKQDLQAAVSKASFTTVEITEDRSQPESWLYVIAKR